MTDEQVRLFEQGFAAYADGIPRDAVPAFLNIDDRRWWLKGWYASRSTNEGLAAKIRLTSKTTANSN